MKPINSSFTMTVGTYKEQIERTAQVKDENLIYYDIVLFGDWDEVTELTRKFSLCGNDWL